MKIQDLTIHNMASIEDARIDFSARPLSDCDVFLISGKTGSGKSTILDSICLALYGTTPRLDGTRMQGAVNDSGKDVQIDDPAQLLREGTGEGRVLLTFEGSDGIPYEAEWSISRAHKKATGRLQGKEWRLKDLRTGMEYTKDREIKSAVEKAVGLTFGQFCRTTMLAQGEFTRFLNSKDEEKAEILEMITGADIYSKIGAKVFEIAREKESAYKEAKDAMQGIILLTEGQKVSKQGEIDGKRKAIDEATKAMGEAKDKADWLERSGELAAMEEDAVRALGEAEATIGTEAFLAEERLVRSFRETAGPRGDLASFLVERAKVAKATNRIDLLSGSYQKVRSGLGWLLGRKKTLEDSLAGVKDALAKEEPIKGVIDKCSALYAQLDIMDTGVPAVDSLAKEIREQEKHVTETLSPVRGEAGEKLAEATRVKDGTYAALKAADRALAAAGLPDIRKENKGLAVMQVDITLAKERIRIYRETWTARDTESKAIAAKERDIADKVTARAALFETVCEHKTRMEVAQRAYEVESKAKENFVGDMRRKLEIGDFCPVCMQEIRRALPTDAEVAARLKPIEAMYQAAKTAYEQKRGELERLDATIATEKRQLADRKAVFDADTALASQYGSLLESLGTCGINGYDANTEYLLGVKVEQARQRKVVLDDLEAKGAVLEENVSAARRADDLAGERLDAATRAFSSADNAVNVENARITENRAILSTRKEAVMAAVSVIDGIVAGTRWETAWKKDCPGFRQDVEDAVSAHEEAMAKMESLEGILREVSREAGSAARSLGEIEMMKPTWADLPHFPDMEVENLSSVADSMKETLTVESRILSEAKETADIAWTRVQSFLSENPDFTVDSLAALSRITQGEISAHENNQKNGQGAVLAAKASLETIRGQVREHAGKRPAIGEGETVRILRDKQSALNDTVLARTGEITLLEAELDADKENQRKSGDLAAKADALRVERDKWARLNMMIGDRDGKTFRKIAQSYVLGSLVQLANHYMKDLSDRYVLKVVPGTFIISVEDAWQGFASRPASTISGGESFLVSLSLALALSDIGDTLSVDTLFIDEGFGTLSGKPLQNAVDTLKTLRTKAGRHVGIISHIEELRERIPVQIQVDMDGRTGSSSVMVVGG